MQIEEFVKPFLHGENIGCFALSEPGWLQSRSFDQIECEEY